MAKYNDIRLSYEEREESFIEENNNIGSLCLERLKSVGGEKLLLAFYYEGYRHVGGPESVGKYNLGISKSGLGVNMSSHCFLSSHLSFHLEEIPVSDPKPESNSFLKETCMLEKVIHNRITNRWSKCYDVKGKLGEISQFELSVEAIMEIVSTASEIELFDGSSDKIKKLGNMIKPQRDYRVVADVYEPRGMLSFI